MDLRAVFRGQGGVAQRVRGVQVEDFIAAYGKGAHALRRDRLLVGRRRQIKIRYYAARIVVDEVDARADAEDLAGIAIVEQAALQGVAVRRVNMAVLVAAVNDRIADEIQV